MYLFNSRLLFNSAPHAECNLIFFRTPSNLPVPRESPSTQHPGGVCYRETTNSKYKHTTNVILHRA